MNHKLILSLLLFLMTGCYKTLNITSFNNTFQTRSFMITSTPEPKSLVVLANSGDTHNAIIFSNDNKEIKIDKVREYIQIKEKSDPIEPSKIMSKREFNARFGSLLNALPAKALSYQLYFKENHMTLTPSSKELLPIIVKKIIEKSPCMVDIIGHTDTTGDENENFDLSLEEANNVKAIFQEEILKYLTSKKDITLTTKGYGEKDLLIPTPNNQKEIKNRFVEIYIK